LGRRIEVAEDDADNPDYVDKAGFAVAINIGALVQAGGVRLCGKIPKGDVHGLDDINELMGTITLRVTDAGAVAGLPRVEVVVVDCSPGKTEVHDAINRPWSIIERACFEIANVEDVDVGYVAHDSPPGLRGTERSGII
jgi:hypothetical protein